jgi:hypothetical protein
MDSKNFLSLLKKPARLTEAGFDDLLQLAKKYPYASVIHTLIAKKAHSEFPDDYDGYLAKAAIYGLDRKKLYYLIHEPTDVKEETAEETITENFTKEAITIQHNEPKIENAEEEILQPETVISEPEKIIEPDIIPHKEENKTITEVYTTEISGQEIKPKEKKEKKKKKHKKKQEEAFPVNSLLTFTEWLKYVNKHKMPQQDELEEHIAAGHYEAQIIIETRQEEQHLKPIPQPLQEWRKTVDETTEIRISDLAERSIQKNENTITETFAKILELQKKYPQAIDAYEKLRLKYPEKSSYFALRIEEIKKKI